jgi:AcrR family transcriptional regulator
MNIHSVVPGSSAKAKTAPTRSSIRAIAGDKREAIMAAALDLFVERGFYGTAVPEIADRAGVGAGTIYRYFDSKEALVNELYRREKTNFAHHVIDDFRPPEGARELFRMLWTRMAKFSVENMKSFVFLELHHHARYLDAESRALQQRMLVLFTHVIVSAQARGQLKPTSPHLLMAIVMGALVGVVRSLLEFEAPFGEAEWQIAEQCVWEAIRA